MKRKVLYLLQEENRRLRSYSVLVLCTINLEFILSFCLLDEEAMLMKL